MNKLIMLALAGAASAAFSTPGAFAQNTDTGSYRGLSDKAASDYKAAHAACDSSSGNVKKICVEQARVARAQAEADATAQYRNTPGNMTKARSDVAKAEYDLAKARCADSSGAQKNACLNDAKAARTAALADAKAGTNVAGNDAAGNNAMRQQSSGVAARAEDCDRLDGTEKAACVTRNTAGSAKNVVADTVITTKLKADLVRDPDLKAMDVHVETVNGVVMLSGFVPSQEQADKAVGLARGIDGVSEVKNGLKLSK